MTRLNCSPPRRYPGAPGTPGCRGPGADLLGSRPRLLSRPGPCGQRRPGRSRQGHPAEARHQTAGDITEVIQLCESALKKGLDKGNAAFANDLLASALVQARQPGGRQGLPCDSDEQRPRIWKTDRSEALADLERGLKLSPKQPQAHFEVAKLNLLPGGDSGKALEALDKTIALASDDAKLRAEALLRRTASAGDARQRLADLDEAVRTLPGNAVVLRSRGLLLAEAEKWDHALADFDKAIAADPKQVLAYQMKAARALEAQDIARGPGRPGKGPRRRPGQRRPLGGQGTDLHHPVELQGCRRRALPRPGHRRFPPAAPAASAALYEHLGEQAKALANVEKILQIKPGQPNVMRMRAGLLINLGKFAAAIEELQNLHKLSPGDSLTMLQMGMLYTAMKQCDKAIEVFTAILKDHPDDVEAMRGRADAFLNSGRRARRRLGLPTGRQAPAP